MGQLRVLLVENNRLLRWWMLGGLESEGFLVAAPDSVAEALEISAACQLDVLVTDWHLSEGGDGFKVLDHVRRNSPEVFSILISAEADAELARRARSAGFDLVLQKPFGVAEIIGAVSACAPGAHPGVVQRNSKEVA